MTKPYVIVGSPRANGETSRAVNLAFPADTVDIVMLAEKIIRDYRCPSDNHDDDFLSIVNQMHLANALIFATPVYWYAMAAPLKTLYDRFYDLLGNDYGRRLAGKDVWLIATGNERNLPTGFEVPFVRTAEYFGMRYREAFYLCTEGDQPLREQAQATLVQFGKGILKIAEKHATSSI